MPRKLTKKEKKFIKKNYKVILVVALILLVIIVGLYYVGPKLGLFEIEQEPKKQKDIILGDTLNVIAVEMHGTYGDSFIIKYNDFDILVDAGTKEDKKYVQDALDEFVTDDKLEILILTHLHADHIGAMTSTSFFSDINISVDKIVDAGSKPSSTTAENYVSMRNSFVSKGSKYYSYYSIINDSSVGTKWYIDQESDIFIQFFDTGSVCKVNESVSEINSSSIAFALNYQNNKWFFAGDLPSSCETDLIKNMNKVSKDYFEDDNYVVYKSCHHGSRTSNGDALLSYVKPDLIFIMAGIVDANKQNSIITDQHPYLEALNRMKKYTSEIYWSSINGLSIFSSNGDTVTKTFRGRTVDYYYQGSIVSREDEKEVTVFNSKWYKMLSSK